MTDVAMSEDRDKIVSMKTQNLLLAIRTYDYGRMFITLSNVGSIGPFTLLGPEPSRRML